MTKHNSRYRYKSKKYRRSNRKKYRRSNRKKYRKTGGAVSKTELETVFAHDKFVTGNIRALMKLNPFLLDYIIAVITNSDKPEGETFKQIFENIFIENVNTIIPESLLWDLYGVEIDLLEQKRILNSIK